MLTLISTQGRDTLCNKWLRHVVATGCCNKSPRMTCENHCRCYRILSLRSVARIQTGLNSCDISKRQNKRKQPSSCRCSSADEATCRRYVSQRLVAAICRIVCLGLNAGVRLKVVGNSRKHDDNGERERH